MSAKTRGWFGCLSLATVLILADPVVWAQDRAVIVAETNLGDRPEIRLTLHGGEYEIRQAADKVLRVTETRAGTDVSGAAVRMTKAHVKASGRTTELDVDGQRERMGHMW